MGKLWKEWRVTPAPSPRALIAAGGPKAGHALTGPAGWSRSDPFVPDDGKDVKRGILSKLIKNAGLTEAEYLDLFYNRKRR